MRWLAGLMLFAVEAQAANLTLDGSKQYQPIDGIGVNINVNGWKNGELKPALDALIDQNGMSLVRVIRDPMDWVSSESLVPSLHALDAGALMQVYEQQKMTDLWDTIAYLNQKGLRGKQVIINFMGWTPAWPRTAAEVRRHRVGEPLPTQSPRHGIRLDGKRDVWAVQEQQHRDQQRLHGEQRHRR
jgi:hypothetical protein